MFVYGIRVVKNGGYEIQIYERRIVAGGMLYCADGVVGLSNVVAEAADASAVWRSLILLASKTFPRLPLVGYESGDELAAALDAGFEIGDPLRIWVKARD